MKVGVAVQIPTDKIPEGYRPQGPYDVMMSPWPDGITRIKLSKTYDKTSESQASLERDAIHTAALSIYDELGLERPKLRTHF